MGEATQDLFRQTNFSYLKGFNYRESGILAKTILIGNFYAMIQTPETHEHDKEVLRSTQIDEIDQKYIVEYTDGSKYIGDVDKQTLKPNGIGVFNHSNGDVYRGMVEQGLAHGKGSYRHKNGINYIGDMAHDSKHGLGEEDYGNCQVYKGSFVNGVKNGQGRYEWSTDSYYEGEINDNKKHGHGLLFIKDLETYTGDWFEDKRHGQGKIEYASGDVYEGPFVNNVREGYGTLRTSETILECWFANDVMHGNGTETDLRTKKSASINHVYGMKV